MTYIIERRYFYLSNNKEEILLENRIRNIKTKRKGKNVCSPEIEAH
jgi:hypothetical protein